MLKWAPYPFLRVAFCLGAGIFTYTFVGALPAFMLPLFLFFILIFLGLWAIAQLRKNLDLNNIAGLAALLTIFVAGFLLAHYRTASSYKTNLIHQHQPITFYEGVVDDYITTKPQTIATTLALTRIKTKKGWQVATGRVRLTIAKEGVPTAVAYGDVLVVKGTPALVKPPLNPAQFNYQGYLANQQVYHQQFLAANQFVISGYLPAFGIIKTSIQIRDFLDRQLRKNIPSGREYAIATALVLGIKDYLPDDIKKTYANTGTMHVLAVSGLHVGLLFMGLNLLLGNWSQRRAYKIASFVVLLSFIWLYAFITALSASVLRAVVMFSFILVANTFNKQTNIYNTLGATAFFLLLFNPFYLFEVGFQLSFLAVLGIVYLHPKIYRWLNIANWFGDKIWQGISISVAAQAAVLPLSFYYFHQFPVYFLIANIPAIFLSTIALGSGFFLLAFFWVPGAAGVFSFVLAWSLKLMNAISEALLQLPLAVINGISISLAQTWVLYAMVIFLLVFLVRKRLVYFAGFTLLVLVFSGWQIAAARNRGRQQFLVVYQVPQATALGFISGNHATLLADSVFYANSKNQQYAVQPHWIKAGVQKSHFETLTTAGESGTLATRNLPDGNKLISWQGMKILLCSQPLKKYKVASLNPDYIILTQNAYVAPEVLPNKKEALVVVLTGANSNWYIQKTKKLVLPFAIPVYVTKEAGALVVSAF